MAKERALYEEKVPCYRAFATEQYIVHSTGLRKDPRSFQTADDIFAEAREEVTQKKNQTSNILRTARLSDKQLQALLVKEWEPFCSTTHASDSDDEEGRDSRSRPPEKREPLSQGVGHGRARRSSAFATLACASTFLAAIVDRRRVDAIGNEHDGNLLDSTASGDDVEVLVMRRPPLGRARTLGSGSDPLSPTHLHPNSGSKAHLAPDHRPFPSPDPSASPSDLQGLPGSSPHSPTPPDPPSPTTSAILSNLQFDKVRTSMRRHSRLTTDSVAQDLGALLSRSGSTLYSPSMTRCREGASSSCQERPPPSRSDSPSECPGSTRCSVDDRLLASAVAVRRSVDWSDPDPDASPAGRGCSLGPGSQASAAQPFRRGGSLDDRSLRRSDSIRRGMLEFAKAEEEPGAAGAPPLPSICRNEGGGRVGLRALGKSRSSRTLEAGPGAAGSEPVSCPSPDSARHRPDAVVRHRLRRGSMVATAVCDGLLRLEDQDASDQHHSNPQESRSSLLPTSSYAPPPGGGLYKAGSMARMTSLLKPSSALGDGHGGSAAAAAGALPQQAAANARHAFALPTRTARPRAGME